MKYKIHYAGDLRTKCVHEASGEEIQTDAPVDNKGMGRFFSPTDLASASLASCMMTIVGIAAHGHGVTIRTMEAEVTKHMASSPRRISSIEVQLSLECDADERQRELLKKAALNCPVALSLHPDLDQKISINFSR